MPYETNMTMTYFVLGAVVLGHFISVNAGGLKILGGFTDVFSTNSAIKYGTQYEWGSYQSALDLPIRWYYYQNALHGTAVWANGHGYCWNPFTSARGYCYQRLVVSTQDDPNEDHYEIVGSKLIVWDRWRQNVDRTRHSYGQQSAGNGDYEFTVFSGESWSPGNNAWGYAYLHFIAKKSNRPPLLDAYSYQAVSSSNEKHTEAEQISGTPESTSTRITIAQFRGWTTSWGENSNCYQYIWKAPTRLVSSSLRYMDKEIIESTHAPKIRPLVLENHSSGLSTVAIDFPRIESSEEITTTSTAQFDSAFDFPIDVFSEIEFDAYGTSDGVTFSIPFQFSSLLEMPNPVENSQTVSITLNTTCDPGFRFTYSVAETSERQKIPVDFVFKRQNARWTERKDVEITLRWVEMNADDCCLYDYAHAECGTDRLPMCTTGTLQAGQGTGIQ